VNNVTETSRAAFHSSQETITGLQLKAGSGRKRQPHDSETTLRVDRPWVSPEGRGQDLPCQRQGRNRLGCGYFKWK
jgi:hypothetical protein